MRATASMVDPTFRIQPQLQCRAACLPHAGFSCWATTQARQTCRLNFAKFIGGTKQNGGIVYLPAGLYRLDSPIVVPDGMELRGVGSVPVRDQHVSSLGTALLSYYGMGASDPLYDQALITLGRSSGVRNIRVLYPENKSGTGNPECAFAIRSTTTAPMSSTAQLWVHTEVSFNGANGHYVKKLIAYCYKYAVRRKLRGGIIEGCRKTARLQRNAMAGCDFSAWPDVNGYTQLRTTLSTSTHPNNTFGTSPTVRTFVEAAECVLRCQRRLRQHRWAADNCPVW